MFDMPDDARCRKFVDYLVDNFVAADSDFPPTLWAHAPDVMPVTVLPMELNTIMDITLSSTRRILTFSFLNIRKELHNNWILVYKIMCTNNSYL